MENMLVEKVKVTAKRSPGVGERNIRVVTAGEAKVIKPYLQKARGVHVSRDESGAVLFWRKNLKRQGDRFIQYPYGINVIGSAQALKIYWGELPKDTMVVS